jgi:hypothetical protein
MNSWVWQDSLTLEEARVCEDPGIIGDTPVFMIENIRT